MPVSTECAAALLSFRYPSLYLVFPRNFRMIFLPHTNTVILLEPNSGTITEPGLPVVLVTDLSSCYVCHVSQSK